MNFRIEFKSEGPETVVSIAGRLNSSSVTQLHKTCDQIEIPFRIDLSELLFADEEGINAIRAICARGGQVKGASPYVRLLLDGGSGCKTGGWESRPS